MKRIIFDTLILVILAALATGLGSRSAAAISPAATLDAILYVKPDGTGDCTSWDSACDLQSALGIAVSTDQIWVAAGTYKPTGTSNRMISFVLKSGVALYGGFPAQGGSWGSRDWRANLTTLSGDIGVAGVADDNSYHVVVAGAVDSTAVLDGFTISGGNANDTVSEDSGGGMLIEEGSPTLRNITFYDNYALYGGGIFNAEGSPLLTNITFNDNNADVGGGGMVNFRASPTLSEITFISNGADYGGGLDNFDNSNPQISYVTFSGNQAGNGGGMFNSHSSPALTNVTFSGNTASYGSGMYNYDHSNPVLTNVTFTGNTAGTHGGGMYNSTSSPTLVNAILWNNTPNQIINESSASTPAVTYSDIQGGYTGQGNINLNPNLGSLANNGGSTQTHALTAGSPAIDSGSPMTCPPTDQRRFPRPVDGNNDGQAWCDMGAYEYGSQLLWMNLPLVIR
jgi:hypothetical protein